MKPLLIAGLILTVLSAENALLLPHRWQDARHTLGVMIRSGGTPLVLVTERLGDSYLRQALRQALENDKNVTLITSSRETASEWAMYRSLHACLLSPETAMTFSLLRTSETGCVVSGTLETETLRSASGLMLCKERKAFDETVQLLQQECKAYFER
ncbi:hypothetical protein WCX72_11710 [Sulfurimonas sp. HSL1-6]|uniref:hypothetical protein n=1 Tax=Thiomicrolovo immobilis TaxID=3131935 RepID=UPI0031F8B0C3